MSIHAKWTVLVACLICNTAQAEPKLADQQAYARCIFAFGPVYGLLCRKNSLHDDRDTSKAEAASTGQIRLLAASN
jgi:hypothetical protein